MFEPPNSLEEMDEALPEEVATNHQTDLMVPQFLLGKRARTSEDDTLEPDTFRRRTLDPHETELKAFADLSSSFYNAVEMGDIKTAEEIYNKISKFYELEQHVEQDMSVEKPSLKEIFTTAYDIAYTFENIPMCNWIYFKEQELSDSLQAKIDDITVQTTKMALDEDETVFRYGWV